MEPLHRDRQCDNTGSRMLPVPLPGLNMYKRYLCYIRPAETHPASDQAMLVTTLVKVSLLAALLVPAFLLEYAFLQMWRLAVPLSVAGIVMVGTPLIYRLSHSLCVAREIFIFALFSFKLWECVVFGDVISPGAIWFLTMPLLGIMLGSILSAVAWLIVTNTAMIVTHLMLGNGVVFLISASENPHFLYIFSHIGASLAVVIFLSMVEHSRRRAYQRLKIANEAISDLAIRDALTGVYNRRHIVSEINRAEEEASHFIVCLLDLDHFKQINDTYGHATGDLTLQKVAETIQSEIRHEDCFGRYGGEEFLLLLKDTKLANSKQFLERIRQRVEALKISALGQSGRVTVSGGIAQYRQGESGVQTINRADEALYAAKAAGRNRIMAESPF
jgi:diguanylate cyclase (GGDEF)-like protein